MRFGGFDRWSVRFVGSLAAIAIGVPAVTFGSVAYWDELTSSEVATASGICEPDVYGIVVSGVRYIVEEFTDTSASCNWTVPAGVTEVDALVVGGGGGGGGGNSSFGNAGGGGGGGGVATGSLSLSGEALTVTVGSGGIGGLGGTSSGATFGGEGGQSVVTQSATTLLSAVGGSGGVRGQYTTGGTGGTGGASGSPSSAGASSSNPGGIGPYRHGGGGGGALSAGGNGDLTAGDNTSAGDGGAGTESWLTGELRTYGGGGGGGSPSGTAGIGGVGGGGDGAFQTSTNEAGPTVPTANRGGGGGGGNDASFKSGAAGGSGIVVVRYEVPGSDRDWAFSADWTLGDGADTREYFQADGRVITHDTDGTIESWVYFDPDESTQYSLWGSTQFLYMSTWGENYDVGGTLLDYPIRLGDGWTSRVEVPQRRWTHIAATWNGPSANLYIDGQLADSTTSFTHPGLDTTGVVDFRVGALYDNPATPGTPWVTYWDGMIDEVRVWNDVRTPAEIAAAMHTSVSPSDTNLAAYWDFNQSTGSTVTALGSAGSAATLTAVGAPAYTELATADTASRAGWTVWEFDRSYITAAGGWTVPAGVQAAEVLVVGGGGGGGARVGAGGGAGGFIEQSVTLSSSPVEVTVGSGGSGAGMSSALVVSPYATDGSSSSFGAVIADGGGRGASNVTDSGTLYGHEAGPTSGNGSAGGGSRNVAPGTAGSAGNAGGAG
ncbi:MAG: LamG domain-containing protein, partial [Ilumatobacteraceae bacterium]